MTGAPPGRPALRGTILAWLCLIATPVHADDETKKDVDEVLVRVREHFAKGELAAARDLLIATYAKVPRADLLFALGQVEFNLGHYKEAIDYYERFLATNPAADEAALAHQAIGTARARVDQPTRLVTPPPIQRPPPRHVRDWDWIDTTLLVVGGAALATGTGVFTVGYRRGNDQPTGTLRNYDKRLERAVLFQQTGIAIAAGGAVLAASALVRWRVHRIEVAPITSTRTAGLTVGGRW
jgi:tetratricopeptide (TPR) repeat protein